MELTLHRIVTRALAVAGITVLLGCVSFASAQDVKRAKLGHSFTDSHPRAVAMKQFAAGVAKATNGKVAIDVYGNSTLGSEEKMLIAVQSGVEELYLGAVSPIAK